MSILCNKGNTNGKLITKLFPRIEIDIYKKQAQVGKAITHKQSKDATVFPYCQWHNNKRQTGSELCQALLKLRLA